MATTPTERVAERIVRRHSDDDVRRVTRFPTGLRHRVFEVETAGGELHVVRIATPESRAYLEGGLHWHPILKATGVPVPELRVSGVCDGCPYMLLERLPGRDLGDVYADLPSGEKRSIARAVAAAQGAVGTLPRGRRFGYAFSYEELDATGRDSWGAVVRASVDRSERWIREVGRLDPGRAERVRGAVAAHEPYLGRVEPVPFLDDTTTKNVIVEGGTLSGIVDTDEVCFGDPLLAVGLTNASLLASGHDVEYVEAWLEAVDATDEQRAVVRVYSLLSCLAFLGELGRTFNDPVPFDETEADRLCDLFERLNGSR